MVSIAYLGPSVSRCPSFHFTWTKGCILPNLYSALAHWEYDEPVIGNGAAIWDLGGSDNLVVVFFIDEPRGWCPYRLPTTLFFHTGPKVGGIFGTTTIRFPFITF